MCDQIMNVIWILILVCEILVLPIIMKEFFRVIFESYKDFWEFLK